MRSRALVVALVAVLALVGSLLLVGGHRPHGQARGALAQDSPCADVLLLAAPGSGEGASSTPTAAGTTAGAFVTGFVAAATSRGRSVEQHVVDLRTAGVSVLTPRVAGPADRRVAAYQVRRWAAGVDTGVTRARDLLVERAATCPDQTVVLAGYAQGAMVVHRLLAGLATRPAIQRRVLGAVLVSDGDRVPGTHALLLGSPVAPRRGQGIAHAKIGGVADVPTPRSSATVWSLCRSGDVVCDLGPTTASAAMARSHAYRTGANLDQLRNVATTLAGRTARLPVPAPDPAWSTEQDVALTEQLGADILARDRGALRWSAVGGMPPGLSLTPSGSVTGVATFAGTYDVTYTVRNTVAAAYDRPVTGHVTLTVTPNQVATLAAGGEDGCAVRGNGTLVCWGDNRFGQLGDGGHADALAPEQIGASANWSFVSTGGSHTCAIRTTGSLWCWGLNRFGQLGDGTTTDRTRAVRIGAGPYASVSAGWFHTCAVTQAGTAYCWGADGHGQLGDGRTSTRTTPVRVGGTATWASVEAGGLSSCGTRFDGSAWCWGLNDLGQLGDGTTTQRTLPTRVGTGNDWVGVTPSWLFTCGLTTDGAAHCWGQDDDGQLGTGYAGDASTPQTVAGGRRYTDLAVGQDHACALATDGGLWCWGSGVTGQLGTGGRTAVVRAPVQPAGGATYTRVATGWGSTCARRTDGAVACWGADDQGQLGDGARTLRTTPVGASGARAASAGAAPGATLLPGELSRAASTDPVDLTLMTFNALGSAHTDPTGDEPGAGPGPLRAAFAADVVRLRAADVVGWQELQPDQLTSLEEGDPGYDFYPRLAAGNLGAQTNVMWRASRFRLVRAHTFTMTVLGKKRPFPYVKLQDLATRRMFWVVNVHNSPGAEAAERDAQVHREIDLVDELAADGVPVFLTGDLNALRRPFCMIVGRTPMAAAAGGTASATSCSAPPRMRIDWIFGSLARFGSYVADGGSLVTHATDHHVVSVRVSMP